MASRWRLVMPTSPLALHRLLMGGPRVLDQCLRRLGRSTATRMPLPLTAISAALSRAMDAHVTASWRLGVATGASFSDISVDARRPDRIRLDRQRGKAASPGRSETRYLTPSFFCRLDDEVVYWKTSFLSG